MGIEELRKEIDKVDDSIIELLAVRKKTVMEIAKIKKAASLAVLDENREANLLSRIRSKAKENGLDADFVEIVYKQILDNSKKEQMKEAGKS